MASGKFSIAKQQLEAIGLLRPFKFRYVGLGKGQACSI